MKLHKNLTDRWRNSCLTGLPDVFEQEGDLKNGKNKVLQHKMTGKSEAVAPAHARIDQHGDEAYQQACHTHRQGFESKLFGVLVASGQYGIDAKCGKTKESCGDPKVGRA